MIIRNFLRLVKEKMRIAFHTKDSQVAVKSRGIQWPWAWFNPRYQVLDSWTSHNLPFAFLHLFYP
jgi:hypothetical protein